MAGLDMVDTLAQPARNPADVLRGIIDQPVVQHTLGLVGEDVQRASAIANDPRNAWIGTNPVGRVGLEGLGLLGAALGKIVYHGSPSKFTKFSLGKVGTGEGAQYYGRGLYFADNPAVARVYGENVYPVGISDASITKMMDWDKPVNAQPKFIKDVLKELKWAKDVDAIDRPLGEWLQTSGGIGVEAAADLRKAGIPGVKYLDQGSRKAGKGTYNYVVFDEELPQIIKEK